LLFSVQYLMTSRRESLFNSGHDAASWKDDISTSPGSMALVGKPAAVIASAAAKPQAAAAVATAADASSRAFGLLAAKSHHHSSDDDDGSNDSDTVETTAGAVEAREQCHLPRGRRQYLAL
jgi:hypothetical protein